VFIHYFQFNLFAACFGQLILNGQFMRSRGEESTFIYCLQLNVFKKGPKEFYGYRHVRRPVVS